MPKLSLNQKKVIELMRQGWELAASRGITSATRFTWSSWLQKNGTGKGGETFRTLYVTVEKLVNLKLIEESSKTEISRKRYQLTDLGKACEL